ncbi:hypothetical protein BKA83DRAFT_4431971 [Pisolithus microcarpus]|nr:hypothetical protein BKA83DRAFT_4431971 [Pisolithus microcarpus]
MLRQLVLTNRTAATPEFNRAPWAEACLVTPRHAVHRQWNEAAVRKHARLAGKNIFVCAAEDSIKGEPLTLEQRYAFALRASGSEQRNRRVKRDLDITNGARGVIQDIFLHPHEPPLTTDTGMHHLKHMPSYILVKLGWTRTLHLQGLEPSVIPVEPAVKTYSIRYVNSQGTPVTRHVQRLQYPVTPAFAFTDYRSQGQTLSHVIVDISRPPTGGLNLFNLYVALSRSSGHETIRLLRDFDEKLFGTKRWHGGLGCARRKEIEVWLLVKHVERYYVWELCT